MADLVATFLDLVAGKLTEKEASKVHRNANSTIRLYYKGRMVHEQDVTLNVRKEGIDVTVYGTNESVVMEGFEGPADEITIGLYRVPHETSIPADGSDWPVNIAKGKTLTVQTPSTGLLRIIN